MTYEQIFELVQKNLKNTAAKKIEDHIAVEFDIYGEGEGAFYVEVKDGAITAAPYEYYDRDAKVFITAEELEKIIKGERKAEEVFSEGILMIEGNIDAALELVSLIKAPVKKTSTAKKAPAKKETAKKVVKAEKTIVEETKKKGSTVSKDIKK